MTFLERLRAFCEQEVDARRIEREDRIPDEVINGLRDLGAFGIRIPVEYGGLGLPGLDYLRALMIASTAHPALSELLAAHQAIGVPQPVALFGTEAQRREFLPRCVREISAFALTEPDIGNDPFRMRTTAVRRGETYLLNGVKLWCTNGVLADLLIVLALVPERGMTAFVVEGDAVTVEHRSSFLGLRGLENGVLRLHDVVVPARNRIGAEGQGLEVALAAQDTSRLSLPAVCAAAAKWCLRIAREWSRVRVQWDRPIGEHEAVADKIAYVAATAFALEAMVEVTGRRADEGHDTRTAGEMAKLFASEQAWRIADELVQIRGGRGFETAESAAARGERGVPAEQVLRDLRVTRIFDGSTEALRVFLAQDGLPVLPEPAGGPLVEHLRFAANTSRELARHTGEPHELATSRVVDIAAELHAMTAACEYARTDTAVELADAFCRQSRLRVAELFTRMRTNNDAHNATVAAAVLADRYTWLEDGVLDPSIEGPWIAVPAPRPNLRRTVTRG